MGTLNPGPRWLVLHLPAFRLERCGYGPAALVVLVTPERGAERVVALTPGAVQSGLRRGMTASEARALVPELEVLPWDEAGEQVDRGELIRALEVISDRVSAPWEDTFLAEISRNPKPEAATAQDAVRFARSLGHAARAAVADDPLAARAVAIWIAEDEGSVVVARGMAARVLAPLPVTSLEPGLVHGSAKEQGDLFEALRAVGIETVGQWAALDPAAVAGRYGPLAARLHRVARGGSAGLLGSWTRTGSRELPSVWIELAGATTRQELLFVLPGAVRELSDALAEQDLATVRLRLVLRLEGSSSGMYTVSTGVRLGRPSRSARKLERLVTGRLDRLVVEEEGASAVAFGLEVVEAAPDRGWQPGLSDRAEASEAMPDLVARLADQLGDQAVFAPVLEPVWRPERAWRRERFPRPPSLGGRKVDLRDPVDVLERWEPALPLPRPSILLTQPQPIEVGCEEGRPVRVRLGGKLEPRPGWRPVTRAAGPERLWGEWWTRKPLDREYWVVEVDGRTWWIYREPKESGRAEPHACWWAHGYFD
jgi:protein ImuB